jgi:hypothetical protein
MAYTLPYEEMAELHRYQRVRNLSHRIFSAIQIPRKINQHVAETLTQKGISSEYVQNARMLAVEKPKGEWRGPTDYLVYNPSDFRKVHVSTSEFFDAGGVPIRLRQKAHETKLLKSPIITLPEQSYHPVTLDVLTKGFMVMYAEHDNVTQKPTILFRGSIAPQVELSAYSHVWSVCNLYLRNAKGRLTSYSFRAIPHQAATLEEHLR